MKRNGALVVVLFLATTVPLLGANAQTAFSHAPTWVYEFFTLDVPGAVSTGLARINNRNEIAGSFTAATGSHQGFVWSNGAFTPVSVPGAVGTWVSDLNDNGAIVGSCECETVSGLGMHGFRYAAGAWTIAPFEDVGARGGASAINNHGRMVGWLEVESSWPGGGFIRTRYGYVDWQRYVDITLSGINDAGNLVGVAPGVGAFHQAGTTTTSIVLPFPSEDVPTPGDVNNANTVVGSYQYESSDTGIAYRGFVWSNGKAVSINYPGAHTTSVSGINDAGIIVGHYQSPGADPFNFHGFVAVPRSPVTVTVNGAPGPVTIDRTQPLRVDVAFIAPPNGPLTPAELYVGVVSPYGVFWVDAAGRFVTTPARTFAGTLAGFGPSPAIQLASASSLPPFTYTWFAIVDDDTNGVPNGAFYDLARVTIR